MSRWLAFWRAQRFGFVHADTDPACLHYRPVRPGSRLDRASRGFACEMCEVLRRDFGVRTESGGSR